MKKALIIGVSGQDGAYLAKLLLDQGYEVYGTSRDHEVSSFSHLSALGIKDSVNLSSMVTSDFRSVLTTLQHADPDEIYNLAGQTSVGMSFVYPVETFKSILIGTMNLLECIRLLKKPVKFYNAGSSEVFGNTVTAADENHHYHPRSPYATSKAAAHYTVTNYREAYGIHASTGILFNHESPLRPLRFVTRKIVSTAVRIAAGSKEKLPLGKIDIYRDWGWAPDYVDAMWRILQHPTPDDYVIATGETHSLEDFVRISFEKLGLNWKEHVVSDSSLFRPSDIERSCGNPAKAKEKLGWSATKKFDQIIEELINAEQSADAARRIR
jgi:GDPmannose 4,6-dehydratase